MARSMLAVGLLPLASGSAWSGRSVDDLHAEYGRIFRSGNRNAASHLWSSFVLDRAGDMTRETFDTLAAGYCPISGSPVHPGDHDRYLERLPRVGGGTAAGFLHHCCWPCICDTEDFLHVDTLTVTTSEGAQEYSFVVMGNPCVKPDVLAAPFSDPFSGSSVTLEEVAPELQCNGDELRGATMSDNGYVILGRFFEAPGGEDVEKPEGGRPGTLSTLGGLGYQDAGLYAPMCADRRKQGFSSGMGLIFRQVAGINPLDPSKMDSMVTLSQEKYTAAPSGRSVSGVAIASGLSGAGLVVVVGLLARARAGRPGYDGLCRRS